MNGPVRGLSVHTFAEEPHVLHFLTHESTGEANLLASHDDYLLPVEELLGDDRRKPTEHVVARVHDHALRADA